MHLTYSPERAHQCGDDSCLVNKRSNTFCGASQETLNIKIIAICYLIPLEDELDVCFSFTWLSALSSASGSSSINPSSSLLSSLLIP